MAECKYLHFQKREHNYRVKWKECHYDIVSMKVLHADPAFQRYEKGCSDGGEGVWLNREKGATLHTPRYHDQFLIGLPAIFTTGHNRVATLCFDQNYTPIILKM